MWQTKSCFLNELSELLGCGRVHGYFGKFAEVGVWFLFCWQRGGGAQARSRKLCLKEKQTQLCFPGALIPSPLGQVLCQCLETRLHCVHPVQRYSYWHEHWLWVVRLCFLYANVKEQINGKNTFIFLWKRSCSPGKLWWLPLRGTQEAELVFRFVLGLERCCRKHLCLCSVMGKQGNCLA